MCFVRCWCSLLQRIIFANTNPNRILGFWVLRRPRLRHLRWMRWPPENDGNWSLCLGSVGNGWGLKLGLVKWNAPSFSVSHIFWSFGILEKLGLVERKSLWEFAWKSRKSKAKLGIVSGHAEYSQCFLLRALELKRQWNCGNLPRIWLVCVLRSDPSSLVFKLVSFVSKFILVAFEQRDGIESSHGLPNQLGRVGALFILHFSITVVNYVGFSDFGIEHYVIHWFIALHFLWQDVATDVYCYCCRSCSDCIINHNQLGLYIRSHKSLKNGYILLNWFWEHPHSHGPAWIRNASL